MPGEDSRRRGERRRCLPRARALAAEGTGLGTMRPYWLRPRPPVLWRTCRPGLPIEGHPLFGRSIGVRFGLTRRCSAVPRVRVPSAEDETRASQPVIVEPARVLAVPSLARAERAKSSGTTGRAGTPLMRFRPLQRTSASDALPDAATHRTIPLRRFARRAVPLPRCGACGSVVCCSARRSRDGIAHACMASSLRFFADASSSTRASVGTVPRSNGRASIDRLGTIARAASCPARDARACRE
jgi:hypothetical protein